jgi:hypothetical protein
MVAKSFDSHPTLSERERAAKTPYLASEGINEGSGARSVWALFDEPERLRAEITRRSYEAMGFEPGAELLDAAAFEALIVGERDAFAWAGGRHGFYDGRLLRLGDFEELLAALDRGELQLSAIESEASRWRGAALAEYMARLTQLGREIDELEQLCAMPRHERQKWFIYGEHQVRSDRAESRLAERTAEARALVSGLDLADRTLFAWTYLALDPQRRLVLLTRYRFLLRLQELLERLAPGGQALSRWISHVDRQGYARVRADVEVLAKTCGEARRELAALLNYCDTLPVPPLGNLDGTMSLRALLRVELPVAAEDEADLFTCSVAILNAITRTREGLSNLHDRTIGAILELQTEAEQLRPIEVDSEATGALDS